MNLKVDPVLQKITMKLKALSLRIMNPKILTIIVAAAIILGISALTHSLFLLGSLVILVGVLYPIFLDKWKSGFSFLLVLLGIIMILLGETWFQGYMRANIISAFVSQATRYGDQMDKFSKATELMYADVDANRKKMTEAQATLDAQQQEVEQLQKKTQALHDQISDKQNEVNKSIREFTERIDKQKNQISDINELVRSILVRKTERFDFDDSDRLLLIEKTDGAVYVFFRLESSPIVNFIDVLYKNMAAETISVVPVTNNVISMLFAKDAYSGTKDQGFIVKYIPDPLIEDVYDLAAVGSNTFRVGHSVWTFNDTMSHFIDYTDPPTSDKPEHMGAQQVP